VKQIPSIKKDIKGNFPSEKTIARGIFGKFITFSVTDCDIFLLYRNLLWNLVREIRCISNYARDLGAGSACFFKTEKNKGDLIEQTIFINKIHSQ